MLLTLLAVAPALCADVLVPEATPRDLEDFAVASLFTQMVVDALGQEGVGLEDAEAIRRWARRDADGCYDSDRCPAELWERTDARLAVVMSVGQAAGGLDVDVRLHGADETAPFKVLHEVVAPGAEQAFAEAVARAARDALPLLPERAPPHATIQLEDGVIVGDGGPRELPQVELAARDTPADPAPKDPIRRAVDRDLPPRVDEEEERRRMRIPSRAYARYQDSGLTRDAWLKKSRVHAGRAHLEIAGAWALGDVNRGYGVRVGLSATGDESFETAGTSTWMGAGEGAGFGGWFAVGYAPTWFLETSLAGGVQWGKKHLNTGWECPAADCTEPSSEYDHEAVDAVQALVEPRARVFFLPTGPVKPYALLAFTLRLHDGVKVSDPKFIDYPDAPGGASYGPTGGLGLMVDPGSRFSVFLEAPFTWLVSPTGEASTNAALGQVPGQLDASGYYFRAVGGIAVRL